MTAQRSLRSLLFYAAIYASLTAPIASPAGAQPAEKDISVEGLLKDGWQVAGFTNTFDNRSALILFRHPTETYLVQCRSGYDVTRKPPVYANCYDVK
ncbi:MAG: hypothetical protein ACT4OU_00255 [Hyphomicrobium sp.]